MFGWIEDGCPGVQILGLFCVYTLEMMIIPTVRLRVFKVSLSTLLLVHSMVGLGTSSCYCRAGTIGTILLLIISQEACFASFAKQSI